MAVKLSRSKKKAFDKQAKAKAQDETIQIKRSEWEEMQAAVSQVQTFMEDLVEGNLEIEIIDDEDAPEEEVEADVEVEDGDTEEIEVEGDLEEEEIPEEDPEAEPEEEIEAEDEEIDYNEIMKDPKKRAAYEEFVKATDSDKAEDEKVDDEKADDEEDVEKKKVGDKKIKREIKRKTLKKAADAIIPDFTSRFRDDLVESIKAVDENDVEEQDESAKFRSRFE